MQYKWRTAILPPYKRRCVLRASFIGGLGVIAIVAAGAFMPPALLTVWGLPILLAAGALITWSMLPYKRMTFLENKPDELWVNSQGDLVYAQRGTPTLTIPRKSIDKLFYIDKPSRYGICISLPEHPQEKVRVHNPLFHFERFRHDSISSSGCDLFLSFFSKRTYGELEEYIYT